MPSTDPILAETVARFARGLSLAAEMASDGSYSFVFAEAGRLTLQSDASGEQILLSLTPRAVVREPHDLARLLALGGYQPDVDLSLKPGLTRAGQPVLTLALNRQGFDLPRLEAGFEALRRCFERAGL